MKAHLYVQGNFWATIVIPGDSLLGLLAKGMITEANRKAQQLAKELDNLEDIECSINLRYRDPVNYTPPTNTEL